MQAGVGPLDGHPIAGRRGGQRLHQRALDRAVVAAHAVDVALEVAVLDKARQHELLHRRHRARVEAERASEPLGQMRGQHRIGDTERGPQAAREGVDVDDAVDGVDALHGGDGTACQAKLAVVVVLHQVAARLLGGPAQQLVAAADGRDEPRGELVRRHEVRHARARRPQGRDVHAGRVHRHVGKRHVVGPVDAGQTRIAWIFHSEAAGSPQQLDDQVVHRLRTRRDDDLRRIGLEAAEGAQMRGQRLAQPERAERRRLAEQRALGLVGQHVAQRLRPERVGEEAGRHRAGSQVGDEGAGGVIGACAIPHRGAARLRHGACRRSAPRRMSRHARSRHRARDARPRVRRSAGCLRARWRFRSRAAFQRSAAASPPHRLRQRERVREVARARHGPHVPLGHELGVGALHGDEAHPEVLRERALRRQLRVCRDGARLDVAPDAAVEVAVQAFLAAILERVREHAASLPFRSPPPSLPRCAWRSMVHISLRAFRLPRSAFCAPRFVPRVWPCI